MTDLNARLAEIQRELADSFAGPEADDNDGHAMALECERRDILAELAAREAKTYRVRVFAEVYEIRATSERQARSKACGRYVRSHDWFAHADPWKATAQNSEVLPA